MTKWLQVACWERRIASNLARQSAVALAIAPKTKNVCKIATMLITIFLIYVFYLVQWLCECSEETLTKKELELCKTEAACDAFCQALAGVSGECQGWGCQCRMSDRVVLENVLIKQVEARKGSNPPQANTANVRPKPSLIVELPPDLQPPDL